MSSSHLPNYSFAQLVHQWTPKNGNSEPKLEISEPKVEASPIAQEEDSKPLSKLERLQYVGGIRRIEVQRAPSKQAGIDSPMGRQNLAKMSAMKQS